MSYHQIQTSGGFYLGGDLAYFLQGIYEMGILVFLLVFTIIFATLQKTQILGSGKKNYNIVVSLVLGLMVIIPHMTGQYPSGYDIVDIVNTALPEVSLIAVAAIMLLLLIGLFGGEARWIGGSLSGGIALLAFIIIGVIFLSAAGFTSDFYIYDWIEPDTLTLVVIILVFAMIVWYITRDDDQADRLARTGGILEELGNFFGGNK